jgi:predicted ATPase/class 3 adenylate cyclase
MTITEWLRRIGLEDRLGVMFRTHALEPDVLPDLTEADLVSIGVALGDRKRVMRAIAADRAAAATVSGTTQAEERRQVTLMFADLVGSTALSAGRDPEELHAILQGFLRTCADAIAPFGGTVVKYMGDGVLACFGLPHAHEDDPRRALLAGLEMMAAVASLNDHMRETYAVQLGLRIGVHTGPVVIGAIGSGAHLEPGAIIGETPNIAARLQAEANENEIIASDVTRRLAGPNVLAEDLGFRALKGVPNPVRLHRVLGWTDGDTWSDEIRAATPMVNRTQEIGTIMARAAEIEQGSARFICLYGDPGCGKSRLVQEVRHRLADDVNILMLTCSQYHQNTPFFPLLQQLTRGLHFTAEEGPALRLARLSAWIDGLALPRARILAPIAKALGLAVPGQTPALDARRERAQFLEAMLDIGEALMVRRPMLLVVEDAQWCDPSLAEFFALAANRYRGKRMLMVMTCRADTPPGFAPEGTERILLDHLDDAQSREIALHAAGGRTLPDALLRQIVQRSDGVPLYIEELTRSLIESGVLVARGSSYVQVGDAATLAIPNTLQDSLMARLDRLTLGRNLVRLAAVFGRTVWHQCLAVASGLSAHDLEAALGEILDAGILVQTRDEGQRAYAFRHALLQQTAYQSLVRPARLALHRRAAEALETVRPALSRLRPEALAIHVERSGNTERAIELWQNAGRSAVAASANIEAIAHFRASLDLIQQLPVGPERDSRELAVLLLLGAAQLSVHGFAAPAVEETYRAALALTGTAPASATILPALWGMWGFYVVAARLTEAEAIARDFLRRSRLETHAQTMSEAHYCLGVTQFYHGALEEADAELTSAVDSFDPAQRTRYLQLFGVDLGTCAMAYRGWVLALLGHNDAARTEARRASVGAEAEGHGFSQCFALTFEAQTLLFLNDTAAARPIAQQAADLAGSQGYGQMAAQAMMQLGRCDACEGDAQAVDRIIEGFRRYRATGAILAAPYALAWIAEGEGNRSNLAAARRALDEATALSAATGESYYDAEICRLKARFLAYGPEPDRSRQAMVWLRQAADIAGAQKAVSLLRPILDDQQRLGPDLHDTSADMTPLFSDL